MDLEAKDTRRHHPFGRVANWFVLGGTSLSIIQSGVVTLGAVLAPATEGFELEGPGLLIWLVLGGGIPAAVGWTAVRALRAWWRRSVTVVGRILLAGLLALPSTILLRVPVGDEVLTPIGYLPAGLMMVTGAFVARARVVEAQREGRGGLAD